MKKQGEPELLEAIFGGEANSGALSGEAKSLLRDALHTLTPREEKVLRLLFGIDCEQQSRTTVARGLPNLFTKQQGVTPVRVEQIESKALRKLRHPKRARKLAPEAIKLGLGRSEYLTSLINTTEQSDV